MFKLYSLKTWDKVMIEYKDMEYVLFTWSGAASL